MFGILDKKMDDGCEHWYTLIPGFNTSTKEFYDAIELDLKEHKIPGLEISRIEFAEGGMLSKNREYLRITRERLVFDICAAPFGTDFFFSGRFAQIPVAIAFWQILGVFLGLFLVLSLLVKIAGLILGGTIFLFGFLLFLYTLRNAVAMGLKDLDDAFIKSPFIGPMYEQWFRKETYYREDTRRMYHDGVDAIVKARVEDVTGAKGIKLICFNEYRPILGELFKERTVTLPRKPS
jgi:hypothetical protein